ncbi:hypothetical protein D3C84_1008800 [compost metagenome]
MPMPAMVPALPLLRAMSVPLMPISSLAALLTLLTVRVMPLKVWPLSLVRAVTLLNRSTALPFSVKDGLVAVAAREGAVRGGSVSPLKLSKLVPKKSAEVMRTSSTRRVPKLSVPAEAVAMLCATPTAFPSRNPWTTTVAPLALSM